MSLPSSEIGQFLDLFPISIIVSESILKSLIAFLLVRHLVILMLFTESDVPSAWICLLDE